jgi:4'-phosphopantetheinyl transferase
MDLSLPVGTVHVWRMDATLERPNVERYWETLSSDERMRAHRFYCPEHQTQYAVTRGVLRMLAGRYLHREPTGLKFVYGPHGKPGLPRGCGSQDLRFNASHSENLVLYAFACGQEVGVDIERVRENKDAVALANRWFTDREAEMLRKLPASRVQPAFFKTWVRKEAYLKACGEGLARSMRSFEVPACTEETSGIVEFSGEGVEKASWHFEDLPVGPEWAAAVVSRGSFLRPEIWDWMKTQ